MDKFPAAILWLSFPLLSACQEGHLEVGKWSFTSDEVLLDLMVLDGFWGQDVCVEMVSSVVMTDTCVSTNVDVQEDTHWLEIPVTTSVGDMNFTIRVHNGVVKVPQSSVDGYVEGVLMPGTLDSAALETRRTETTLRIEEHRKLWESGAFSLQNERGEVKGAMVFVQNEVRVMVFDRHWLTPEVQYSTVMQDGLDWLISFDSEPQFFDVPTYVRVHPLELKVSIPQGERRSTTDIQYNLVPHPPDFEALEILKQEQLEISLDEERLLISEHVQTVLRRLTSKDTCQSWTSSGALNTPFWLGYDVYTVWDNLHCTVYVEPSIVQYRRAFSGRISSQTVIP